jgi:hypothetical protein
MTPQERQLIDDLFDRLAKLESAPRDPNAAAAIAQGLRTAPNAVYGLVQTVLVQDEALRHADSRIQELEAAAAPQPNQSGGFLDSMRESIFGQSQSHGSVPNVPPPEPTRPVWNSGQLLQQGQPQDYQGHYNEQPYGQSYGAPPSAFGGGGGSFLGTAAASAAGVIGGSLLLNSFRSMMGGSRQSFADAGGIGNRSSSQTPWSDQSGSNLSRDAGINDINSSSQDRADDTSRAGLFDQASNDDSSNGDNDQDDMDSDDFGGDGDSDYA